MRCFPMCTDIQDAVVILAGEGRLIWQRLGKLRPFGCRIRLFAESGFEELEADPQIELVRRRLQTEDFAPKPVMAAVAGADREESRRISALCQAHGVPVNVADMPDLCTFYFPAMIQNGSLTIAISTDGKYPAAAALLRQRLEPQIPDRMDEILDWAQELRQQMRAQIGDSHRRGEVLRAVMTSAMERNRPLTPEEVSEHLSP